MRNPALLAPALILASAACGQDGVADYTFRDPGLAFDGVSQLADLRGKPVLIEFWGTR